jgi:hypothetical protein
LSEVEGELSDLTDELEQLEMTKEIDFGNGLRVFEIDLPEDGWGSASGKVQNISDQPMERVYIVIAGYSENGLLQGLVTTSAAALFPEEVAEWSTYFSSSSAETYDIYALGDKQD